MRTGRPRSSEYVIRTCEVCGGTWESAPYAKSKIRYCSRECWAEGRRGEKREPYAPRETKNCEKCGTEFIVGGHGNKPRHTRFCSQLCSVQGRWVDKEGHEPVRQMSPEEVAWLAGVFDGEGTVRWPRRRKVTTVALSMTNTSLKLLERLREVSGTGIITDRSHSRRSPLHSPVWVWTCHGQNAKDILRKIEPWLIVKQEAAHVALGIIEAVEPPLSQRSRTRMMAEEVVRSAPS